MKKNEIALLLLCLILPFSSSKAEENQKNKLEKKIPAQAFNLCESAVDLAAQGKYDVAIVYLRRALDIDPKFPDALFNLGSISRAKGAYQDSYSAFQQLLLMNPNDHEARLEKILTLIEMKNYKEAEYELKRVPESHERYASVKDKLDLAIKSR